MERKTPAFFRLVQIDYPSVIAVSFPVMVWIIFGILYILGLALGEPPLGMLIQKNLISGLFYVGIVLSLICSPILFRRYRYIHRVFSEGIEVEGVIRGVGFFRDRGVVEVSYEYQGEKYTSRSAVQKEARTQALKSGITVAMVIDKRDPEKAFIKDLYL